MRYIETLMRGGCVHTDPESAEAIMACLGVESDHAINGAAYLFIRGNTLMVTESSSLDSMSEAFTEYVDDLDETPSVRHHAVRTKRITYLDLFEHLPEFADGQFSIITDDISEARELLGRIYVKGNGKFTVVSAKPDGNYTAVKMNRDALASLSRADTLFTVSFKNTPHTDH